MATGLDLSDTEIGIIFGIFDKKRTGKLDHTSFIYLTEYRSLVDTSMKDKQTMAISKTLLFSQIAASIGATCVFPLDKVKTRLQSQLNPGKGPVWTFRHIIITEGVRGLYKGLGPQLVGITPEKVLKLTANDLWRKVLKRPDQKELTLKQEALAGILTGFVQVSITNPYEIVKIRLQVQTHDSVKKSAFQVVRELGIFGMYKGLSATMLRDIPFNAIYFSLYAYFKQKLKDDDGHLTSGRLLISGAGAATFAAAFDTPADSIKTRLQNGRGQYKGLIDCVKTMWKLEGYRAFLKGMSVRVTVIAPLFSITFTIFETLQRLFAPGTKVPVALLEEDIDHLRRSRLRNIEAQLKSEYGIDFLFIHNEQAKK